MNEHLSPSVSDVETPLPFRPESPQGTGGGCSRAGLLGCGLVILLLGLAAVLFLFKAGDLFAWAMTKFEAQVIQALPEDFSFEERQRLEEAFRAATETVRQGEADPLALQRLQERLRESVLDRDGKLTREEVLELITTLEEVAGVEPLEPSFSSAAVTS